MANATGSWNFEAHVCYAVTVKSFLGSQNYKATYSVSLKGFSSFHSPLMY